MKFFHKNIKRKRQNLVTNKFDVNFFSNVLFVVMYAASYIHVFLHSIRKMVHPHVPVGIPCYDFTPVIDSLLNTQGASSKSLNSHGMTGGECKEQGHIHGGMADPPLLANPTSCSRVPDYNPNWG